MGVFAVGMFPNKDPDGVEVLALNRDPVGFPNSEVVLALYYFLPALVEPKREVGAGLPPIPPNISFGGSSLDWGLDRFVLPNSPPYFLYDVFSVLVFMFENSPPLGVEDPNSPPPVELLNSEEVAGLF